MNGDIFAPDPPVPDDDLLEDLDANEKERERDAVNGPGTISRSTTSSAADMDFSCGCSIDCGPRCAPCVCAALPTSIPSESVAADADAAGCCVGITNDRRRSITRLIKIYIYM